MSAPEWLTAFKRYRRVYGEGKMSQNTTVRAHSMQRESFIWKNYPWTPQNCKVQEMERLFCIAKKNEMYSKSFLPQNRKQKAFYTYPIWEKWRKILCSLLRLIFNAEMKVHAEVLACFWLSISGKGKFLVKEYYYHLHSTFPTSSGVSHILSSKHVQFVEQFNNQLVRYFPFPQKLENHFLGKEKNWSSVCNSNTA